MLNKKSIGLHWEILLISLFVSVGIIYFQTQTIDIPKVGEFSVNTVKSLEQGKNIPILIDKIMKQLNKKASISYENHKIFGLDSYCKDNGKPDDSQYKIRLIAEDMSFDPIDSITKRNPIKCYADENELMKFYEESFNGEYSQFRAAVGNGPNLDFSSINYYSSMSKDNAGNYLNTIKTDDDFLIPIIMKKGQENKEIGRFKLSPDYKFEVPNPPNRPFDKTEICIFARVCGATCHDVLEKYPSGPRDNSGYEIINDGFIAEDECERYYNCQTPRDDFDKTFACSTGVLCYGQCLPFCSVQNSRLITDDALGTTVTPCVPYTCAGVGIAYDRFCKIVAADDCDSKTSTRDCTPHTCSGAGVAFDADCNIVSADDCNAGEQNADLTQCTEFSCSSYMDCLNIESCGCPDPSAGVFDDTCIGNDCETLHCSRDIEFEAKVNRITNCRTEACSHYDQLDGHSCAPTNLCECSAETEVIAGMQNSFVPNACEGDCTCIERHTNLGCDIDTNCGYSDEWLVDFPYGCQKDQYTICGECNPDCDPCECNADLFGCGFCGWEECIIEEEEDDTTILDGTDAGTGEESTDGRNGGDGNGNGDSGP